MHMNMHAMHMGVIDQRDDSWIDMQRRKMSLMSKSLFGIIAIDKMERKGREKG